MISTEMPKEDAMPFSLSDLARLFAAGFMLGVSAGVVVASMLPH